MDSYTSLFDKDNKDSLLVVDPKTIFKEIAFQLIWGFTVFQNTLKGKLLSPIIALELKNANPPLSQYLVGNHVLKIDLSFKVVLKNPQFEIDQNDVDSDLEKISDYLKTISNNSSYQEILIKTLKTPAYHRGYGALAYLFSPIFVVEDKNYWTSGGLIENKVITFDKPNVKKEIKDKQQKKLKEAESEQRKNEEEAKQEKLKQEIQNLIKNAYDVNVNILKGDFETNLSGDSILQTRINEIKKKQSQYTSKDFDNMIVELQKYSDNVTKLLEFKKELEEPINEKNVIQVLLQNVNDTEPSEYAVKTLIEEINNMGQEKLKKLKEAEEEKQRKEKEAEAEAEERKKEKEEEERKRKEEEARKAAGKPSLTECLEIIERHMDPNNLNDWQNKALEVGNSNVLEEANQCIEYIKNHANVNIVIDGLKKLGIVKLDGNFKKADANNKNEFLYEHDKFKEVQDKDVFLFISMSYNAAILRLGILAVETKTFKDEWKKSLDNYSLKKKIDARMNYIKETIDNIVNEKEMTKPAQTEEEKTKSPEKGKLSETTLQDDVSDLKNAFLEQMKHIYVEIKNKKGVKGQMGGDLIKRISGHLIEANNSFEKLQKHNNYKDSDFLKLIEKDFFIVKNDGSLALKQVFNIGNKPYYPDDKEKVLTDIAKNNQIFALQNFKSVNFNITWIYKYVMHYVFLVKYWDKETNFLKDKIKVYDIIVRPGKDKNDNRIAVSDLTTEKGEKAFVNFEKNEL